MSAEAWAAFLNSLVDSLSPVFWGALGGWMLRGEWEARRRRKDE